MWRQCRPFPFRWAPECEQLPPSYCAVATQLTGRDGCWSSHGCRINWQSRVRRLPAMAKALPMSGVMLHCEGLSSLQCITLRKSPRMQGSHIG